MKKFCTFLLVLALLIPMGLVSVAGAEDTAATEPFYALGWSDFDQEKYTYMDGLVGSTFSNIGDKARISFGGVTLMYGKYTDEQVTQFAEAMKKTMEARPEGLRYWNIGFPFKIMKLAPKHVIYLDHGIDLETDWLEVGVCAQHMNGGLEGDIWYESPALPRLFICGEANGVFGIRRPGGSALNSTQVSSRRAAEKAVHVYTDEAVLITEEMLSDTLFLAGLLDTAGPDTLDAAEIRKLRSDWGRRMDHCGAFLRDPAEIEKLTDDVREALLRAGELRAADVPALIELQIHLDTMLTRYAVLSSMTAYIRDGGLSRGSYLILENGQIPASPAIDSTHADRVGQVSLCRDGSLEARCSWQNVRPIPTEEHWFEQVYNRSGKPESYR